MNSSRRGPSPPRVGTARSSRPRLQYWLSHLCLKRSMIKNFSCRSGAWRWTARFARRRTVSIGAELSNFCDRRSQRRLGNAVSIFPPFFKVDCPTLLEHICKASLLSHLSVKERFLWQSTSCSILHYCTVVRIDRGANSPTSRIIQIFQHDFFQACPPG